MVDDSTFLWKSYARRRLAESSLFIPLDMGMEFVGNMTCGELVDILRKAAVCLPLTAELRNLVYSDLVVVANDAGATKYLSVEIAFNAKQRHASTAIRYAQLLQELSGIPTVPVVASYNIEHEVRKAVDSGLIYWHFVPDHVLDSREVEKERRLFQSDDFRSVI